MINRRDFIGGAACGSAVAVGSRVGHNWLTPPAPLPSPPQPPPALPEHARLSFSQQGEDIVVYHVLHDLLKIETPTYMDVGAAYPVRGNNTYLLYTAGVAACWSSRTRRSWRYCDVTGRATPSWKPASA